MAVTPAELQATFGVETAEAELRRLVEITSVTGDHDGINTMANELGAYFRQAVPELRLRTRRYNGGPPALILSAGRDPRAPTVGLEAHYDTVPDGASSVTRRGVKLFGPGTIDCKGGIVVICMALRLLEKYLGSVGNVKVVLSPDEEVGSPVGQLAMRHLRDADAVFGFEGALAPGQYVNQRMSAGCWNVTFTGSQGHAGYPAPQASVAAVEFASRLHRATTGRNGSHPPDIAIQLGASANNASATNTRASRHWVGFTTRAATEALNSDLNEIITRAIKEALDVANYGYSYRHVAAEVECLGRTPTWHSRTADSLYQPAAAVLGIADPVAVARIGGGDIAHAHGDICGLGPVGGAPHTQEEFVFLDSFGPQAAVAAVLIAGVQGRELVHGQTFDSPVSRSSGLSRSFQP